MSLEKLQKKIAELISDYNNDLADDDDDRVATAQLILTRPADRVSAEKPAAVFATPKEFQPRPAPGAGAKAAASGSPTLSSTTTAVSSSIECCAVGWVGIVDSQGVFYSCFPVAGACPTYSGPNKCLVPG